MWANRISELVQGLGMYTRAKLGDVAMLQKVVRRLILLYIMF